MHIPEGKKEEPDPAEELKEKESQKSKKSRKSSVKSKSGKKSGSKASDDENSDEEREQKPSKTETEEDEEDDQKSGEENLDELCVNMYYKENEITRTKKLQNQDPFADIFKAKSDANDEGMLKKQKTQFNISDFMPKDKLKEKPKKKGKREDSDSCNSSSEEDPDKAAKEALAARRAARKNP